MTVRVLITAALAVLIGCGGEGNGQSNQRSVGDIAAQLDRACVGRTESSPQIDTLVNDLIASFNAGRQDRADATELQQAQRLMQQCAPNKVVPIGQALLAAGQPPPDLAEGVDAAPTEEPLEEEESNLPTETAQIGGAAVDDDVTFKVTNIEAVDRISLGEFSDGPLTPSEGAQLVQATVTWKNNMDVSIDVFCGGGGTVLLDAEGRNYDPVEDVIDIEGNEICGADVQPGFRRTDTLVYEIPEDADIAGVALWNPEAEDDVVGETFVVFEK